MPNSSNASLKNHVGSNILESDVSPECMPPLTCGRFLASLQMSHMVGYGKQVPWGEADNAAAAFVHVSTVLPEHRLSK